MEICRTGTLAVRRIALLVVERKVVKIFLTWQKLRENVEKSVEKSSKNVGQKCAGQKYHFSSTTTNQSIR